MHGTKVVVVPYEHSVAFAAKLDAIGVDQRFTLFDRYRHVDRRFNQAATTDDVIEFLRGDSQCSNARTSPRNDASTGLRRVDRAPESG